jgi:hypothetical protein
MALTAQSIVQRAVGILQDTTSVRWPVDELVRALNDGQREIVLYRPDSNTKVSTGTLVVGTRQDMTTMTGVSTNNPAKLIDITRNMAASSTKKAVRLIAREILDAQTPGWHNVTGAVDVVHFMFDPRDPRAFYVYPPATALAQLEIVYAAYPTDVTAPTGSDYTSVTGTIGVADIYGNALLDYILYRSYMKDSEYAGNAQRAQAHYAAFANSLGVELKATLMTQPNMNVTYNPNTLAPKTGAA